MLEDILNELHNWFERDRLQGEFTVTDGELALPDGSLKSGQYYRICGSVFNDGLHCWPEDGLVDEAFSGEVITLAIPLAVLSLSDEIKAWCAENPVGAQYQSESFGGYSYTKASGADGVPLQWQQVFRTRLNNWRRLPCL